MIRRFKYKKRKSLADNQKKFINRMVKKVYDEKFNVIEVQDYLTEKLGIAGVHIASNKCILVKFDAQSFEVIKYCDDFEMHNVISKEKSTYGKISLTSQEKQLIRSVALTVFNGTTSVSLAQEILKEKLEISGVQFSENGSVLVKIDDGNLEFINFSVETMHNISAVDETKKSLVKGRKFRF